MKERVVDSRCKECFELNPIEVYCESSPTGYHKIEPYSGTLEQISVHGLRKLRKSKVKSVADVTAKINSLKAA